MDKPRPSKKAVALDSYGKRLRYARDTYLEREGQRMSRERLAALMGVSGRTILRREIDSMSPESRAEIEKTARLLNVDPDWLETGEGSSVRESEKDGARVIRLREARSDIPAEAVLVPEFRASSHTLVYDMRQILKFAPDRPERVEYLLIRDEGMAGYLDQGSVVLVSSDDRYYGPGTYIIQLDEGLEPHPAWVTMRSRNHFVVQYLNGNTELHMRKNGQQWVNGDGEKVDFRIVAKVIQFTQRQIILRGNLSPAPQTTPEWAGSREMA